jgi:alpha-1,3-rhamnosyl/mannosyltransferase
VRVGINLLWLVPRRVGGTEMATVSLLRELAARPREGMELSLYALDAFAESYPELVKDFPCQLLPITGVVRPLRVGAENSWLARRTRGRVDLVHHMGGVLPLVQGATGVVTIHDLQPFDMPENFTPTKRLYLQRSIPRSVRRAAGVIVPTDFVRHGVLDRFDVDPDHVHVARWGVDPPANDVSVAQVQARYGLPRRWFVFPSFTWNHKNHVMLLQAFAAVAAREHDVMLVLTGGEGPAEQDVLDEILRLGLRGRVRRTGLVPRRDVLAIVRGAVALTWPSRYDGFGLPVLEGMSLGTPVLSSNAAALPEVVGDAGWLLPPDDGDAWTEAMIRVLEDGVERQRLAEAGARHVAGYGWRETADATVAAYRAALATTAEPATRAEATTAEPATLAEATTAEPATLAEAQPDPVADPDAAPDPDAAAAPADAPEDGVAS